MYEYHVEIEDSPLMYQGQPNMFGENGWELVQIIKNDNSKRYYFYFKREIQNA